MSYNYTIKAERNLSTMTTILNESLNFIGISIAGGITWDLIKTSPKLIKSFYNKFEEDFSNKEEVSERFLESISTKQPLSEINPFDDMEAIYKNCTRKKANSEFVNKLKEWLDENKNELENLNKNNNVQNVKIETQNNVNGNNIGIQYNYN
ncbi:hypothetical protein DAF96_12025 [Clostridioides difficile]|nr:hypothetical protein [Clostridioides difficile]